MTSLDLVVKNVRVVRPRQLTVERLDLGVKDGRFALVAPEIPAGHAREVFDGRGLLAFPGLVDAHTHVGIYAPLADDAVTESKAAAMGGVTTMLTYFRTGQYYLNRGGSWRDFFPDVLKLSEDRYWCDYAYHLAPIESLHLEEMEMLAVEHGVPSFKIFMFYGGYGLHGRTDDDAQRRFLMLGPDDSYDLAHFEFVMRSAARLCQRRPELGEHVSVSLHCEMADVLNAYTKLVQRDRSLAGLRAYSAARPPHGEGLAVWIAAYLAHETGCRNINLLHLSSRKALDAALMAKAIFPHVDFRREVTVGHLLLDCDGPAGAHAKVNPPIRPREDVEDLWQGVLDGHVDWIVSDRGEGRSPPHRRHLAREIRVRWNRISFVGSLQRGATARPGRASYRGADRVESGAALRAHEQRRHRGRLRRGPRADRSDPPVRRARRRLAVEPGLHAVRRPGAHGPGPGDVPARPPDLRARRDRRPAARTLRAAAGSASLSVVEVVYWGL